MAMAMAAAIRASEEREGASRRREIDRSMDRESGRVIQRSRRVARRFVACVFV